MTLTTILTDTTDEITPLPGRPYTSAFAQAFGNSLKGWRSTTFNPLSRPWADYAARIPLVRSTFYIATNAGGVVPLGLYPREYNTPAIDSESVSKIAYRCYFQDSDSGEDANLTVIPRLEAEKTRVRSAISAQSWQTVHQGASQDGSPAKIIVHELDPKWTMLRVTLDVQDYTGVTDPAVLIAELWGEVNRAGINPNESLSVEREKTTLDQNDQTNDLDSVREDLS